MGETTMTDLRSASATPRGPGLRLLAPEDVSRVQGAALDRLEGDGVVPASHEAREALLAAGASEAADGALRLSAGLAEEAAARAPKRVALGARTEELDVVLEPGARLLAAGGPAAPRAQPPAGGPSGPATLEDLEAACRLADALPEVDVVAGPPLVTAPLGDEGARLAEVVCALRATRKHVQVMHVVGAATAAALADMAGAFRADEAALRRRPPLSLLGGPESFAAAAVLAVRGIPVGVLVAAPSVRDAGRGPTAASDPSPADVTEALVAFVADVLAANAAVQALAPGAAYIAPVWPALAGLPMTGPAAATFIAAATQVLTHAGLPAAAGAFATSAPAPDWQSCTDGSFAALSGGLAGAALLGGAGTVLGATAFSPAQLVADAEIFSWCATIAAGIEVDDETLAVEAIKQVGIGGDFLGQKHTRRHMKDVWRPRLLDRAPWEAWVAGGRQGAAERAAELAGTLLAGHEAEPLDAERTATLERIIATAGL